MGNLTEKKVLFVLAPKNFRDEEYFISRVALQANGAQVVTTSKGVEEATGTKGGKVKIDFELAEVKPKDYEAIVFVGGKGAAGYFKNKKVLDLAKDFAQKEKVIGAICIAPVILANAGILKGKKATSYSSEKSALLAKGAKFTGAKVQQDGKIITASGPEASNDFGKKVAEVLAQ